MAGVEHAFRAPDRRLRRILARSRHQLERRAVRPHLQRLGRTRRLRRHDRRAHTARRGVRRDRRPAIAGAVLQHGFDSLGAQQGQHDAGATVLEAAGRHEPFAFEQRGRIMQGARDQRRAALAHADAISRLRAAGRRHSAIGCASLCRCPLDQCRAAESAAAERDRLRTSAVYPEERSRPCEGRGRRGPGVPPATTAGPRSSGLHPRQPPEESRRSARCSSKSRASGRGLPGGNAP